MGVFTGVGFLHYDWLLTALLYLAGVSQVYGLVFHRDFNHVYRFAKILGALGYFGWASRFTLELVGGGDPQVSIPGMVSIVFIVSGAILQSFLGKTYDVPRTGK